MLSNYSGASRPGGTGCSQRLLVHFLLTGGSGFRVNQASYQVFHCDSEMCLSSSETQIKHLETSFCHYEPWCKMMTLNLCHLVTGWRQGGTDEYMRGIGEGRIGGRENGGRALEE